MGWPDVRGNRSMIERILAPPTIFKTNAPTTQKRIAGKGMRGMPGADVMGRLTGDGDGVEGQFGECDVGGTEGPQR